MTQTSLAQTILTQAEAPPAKEIAPLHLSIDYGRTGAQMFDRYVELYRRVRASRRSARIRRLRLPGVP